MVTMLNSSKIIEILQQTLSYDGKLIALHEPHFTGNEWNYVKECIDSGWVSSVGNFVDKFEFDLAHFTGAKQAIATVNGTSALHICFLLAGVVSGDEVLVPTLTFVGTVNAISYCGATPHFIDSEKVHLGIDPIALNDYLRDSTTIKNGVCINRVTNRNIRALCVMHTLGHPVDLDAIEEVCQKYHLILIEDAAEALGSYYKGTHVGHRGLLGALSFNGNKIITTGGGGAILTNDIHLAKKAKHITTTAKLQHPWQFQHDQVAYNYRLPNINAALGCAQLEKITEFLHAKRLLMKQYYAAFSMVNDVQLIQEPSYAKSNYWLHALLLDESSSTFRDNLLESIMASGIMVRPIWNLQHTLPMYQHCPHMPLNNAEELVKRLIKIPSSPQLIRRTPYDK